MRAINPDTTVLYAIICNDIHNLFLQFNDVYIVQVVKKNHPILPFHTLLFIVHKAV